MKHDAKRKNDRKFAGRARSTRRRRKARGESKEVRMTSRTERRASGRSGF